MPFVKGRKKTGGRTKGRSLKDSPRFIDQLQRYGLNTAKELARGLMALPEPQRYDALRQLLPYLIPKLKEIDPILEDSPDLNSPVSTEALLEAMSHNGRKPKGTKPIPDSVPAVEERSLAVQTPRSPEEHLSEVDREQEPN